MAAIQHRGTTAQSGRLIDVLNGPWHERALWIYTGIVLLHWAEHLFQAYQVFVLGWPRPQAGGMLGLWFPWLVTSESLHFGYALFMLVGLIALRPGFRGSSRFWWNVSLAIQAWHFVEHALLQAQAILGYTFFGATVRTSILQLWIPRVELHLFYNAIVFIPMVLAMYYHRYPPKGERAMQMQCTCARVGALEAPQAA